MTYKALARKWRPASFDTMIGQSQVCAALSQALRAGRVHHAYLFTGTRGVGKTTIARLLSQCLNCEAGVTDTPCGACGACQSIAAGNFIDLQEVDAASRTRVEETRALLENVPYAPVQGRYKIYLIDEVHMLSAHSFNALLKTLEEPPAHVKFLLATTDPQKLPATVLSRCIQFHLRTVDKVPLAAHLATVLSAEGVGYDPSALDLLSELAEGSVRDALSLLEQAMSTGETVTYAAVCAMLGLAPLRQVRSLVQHILTQQVALALEVIADMATEGVVFQTVLDQLLQILHQLSIVQQVPAYVSEMTREMRQLLQGLEQTVSPEAIQLAYQIALQGKRDFTLAPSPRTGLEMLVLRMVVFHPTPLNNQVNTVLSEKWVEEKLIPPSMPERTPTPQVVTIESVVATSTEIPDWSVLVNQLSLTGLTKVLAAHCHIVAWTDTTVTLSLDNVHAGALQESRRLALEAALLRHFKVRRALQIQINNVEPPESSLLREQTAVVPVAAKVTPMLSDTDAQLKALIAAFDATIEAVTHMDNEAK